MAHFALLWKARTIEKYRQRYENEKINSIIMSRSDVPDKTLFQIWKHYKHGMQKRLSRTFSKWYPEGSTVSNFFVSLKADMKLPSILLRSLYGFIGGLLLTYLGFMFFVFQLSVSLMLATVLSSILGVLLTLGLTFSNRMRCLIFLLLPQLFSRVGRYTLTCYALVLILTGPATNTLKNSEVLSESMACSQEQIKLNVKQINDSIKKPYNSIKDSLKMTIKRMNLVVGKLKTVLISVNKLILNIASTIQSGYSWLDYMAESCNEALGTPHQKCLFLLKEHCEKCNEVYTLNVMEPKNIKRSNRNFIRDILHAIGIKNVKKSKEDRFDYHKKDRRKINNCENNIKNINDKGMTEDTDKANFKAYKKGINNSKDKRGHNGANNASKHPTSDNVQRMKGDCVKPWFCNTDNVAEKACASLCSYEKFCVAADFTGDTFLATIRQKLRTFVRRLSAAIHVQLNVQHTYTYIANSSSSNQVAVGIVTEIRNRADPLLTWLSWSSCVTSLFLLLIIFRAKHYQHMFETRSRFDNRFITKEFRELDLKRLREGRETVLPLNTRERAKYVTTTSFRLVASEKLYLNRSAVFMTVATFKLLIHIVADYSLFWVLTTIRHHGKLHSPLQPDFTDPGAAMASSGFVARFLQALVDSMKLHLRFSPQDHVCLPNPYPPDIKRYCQIGFLIFLLWFFALFEPYGLRLRHLIMGHYRPQRARDRALWLYNHVLRTRASFMKFARRKLHREYKYSSHSEFTLRQCLRNHALLCWISTLLGIKPDEPRCLLCNTAEDSSDNNKELVKCEVPNCPGIYCVGCFSDIGQLCTICLSPSDYGDFSDVSLEKGSSEEDNSDHDLDDNPNGSHKRKSISDFNTLKDDDDDVSNSKRSEFSRRRKIGYFLGRFGRKESDTLPLLKHSVKCYAGYEIKEGSRFTKGIVKDAINSNIYLHKNVKELSTMNNTEFDDIETLKHIYHTYTHKISTIDILLYSLYEITNNPLHITKSQYTTCIAKYLRRRKVIRHKKCNQTYSKFFMSCSNNNINEMNNNAKNGGDNTDQGNNFKKTKKSAKNNVLNNEIKYFYDDIQLEDFGSKNESVSLNIKRRKINKVKSHTCLSKYWKNVKQTVIKNKSAIETKEKIPPNKESKHKIKKKRKKSKENKELKSNEKVVGNSRLFAFLDERDWVNCYDDDNIDKEIHNVEGNVDMKHDGITESRIVVNDILIPRLDLNLSSDSIINPQLQISYEEKPSSTKRKVFAKDAFARFFKSIACSSCELFSSGLHVDNVKEVHCNASEPYIIQGSVQREHLNDWPGSVHSASCKKSTLPEDVRRPRLGSFNRLSKPLFLLKSRCSSIFLHKKENNQLGKRGTNQNKVNLESNLMCNVEARARTAQDKLIIQRSDKQNYFNKTDNKIDMFDKEIQTIPTVTKTDDKGVTALPLVISCGCQNLSSAQTHDFAVQVTVNNKKNKKTCICKDANVMARVRTCACAAQCQDLKVEDEINSDISSIHTSVSDYDDIISDYDASIKETTVCSYANMNDKRTLFDLRKDQMLREKERKEQDKTTTKEQGRTKYGDGRTNEIYPRTNERYAITNERGTRKNYIEESSNYQIGKLRNNFGRLNHKFGRVNDKVEGYIYTTGRVNDEIGEPNYGIKKVINDKGGRHNDPFGKFTVKVITKSNQSTLTDRTTYRDVSTATYDWWSPLVERKGSSKKPYRTVEKRRRECVHPRIRERRTFRNKGIWTGEKVVTFRSKTQLIPRESSYADIMSPSRYLLESQKYYNELFYNTSASPRVYPVTNLEKNHNSERDRSKINNYHRHKGRKTKRLEESYSPRKDIPPYVWMRRFE